MKEIFQIKKMDFLVALYMTCLLVAEFMGGKVFSITSFDIPLLGRPLSASLAIFVVPVLFSIVDVVSEVHGKQRARSIVRSGLVLLIILAIFHPIAMALPPSARSPIQQDEFEAVFGRSFRVICASITAFAVSEFLDVYIYARIREKFGTGKLWLRNNLSNIIGQFFDTVLFITLAYFSFEDNLYEHILFLVSIIIPYWLLKCFMSVIETPFVYLGVNWLRADLKDDASFHS